MKQPAIFFDRDNTLIVSDGYLGDPAKVELVDGAADAVARAKRAGYATVIFSNQSGVGRGMFDEQAVRDVNARLDQMLRQQNPVAVIDRHEFCPYHPEAPIDKYRQDSELRKPKPGMIYSAAEKLSLDLTRSWVVGDAPRDIEAGKAAGLRTILFRDPKLSPSPAAGDARSATGPDFVVATLKEALDIIERHSRQPVSDPPGSAGQDATGVSSPDLARLQNTAEQILHELRRRSEREVTEFSMPRLMGGIVQVIALAVLFFAYLQRDDPTTPPLQSLMLLALVLQTLTVSLLVMGRRR